MAVDAACGSGQSTLLPSDHFQRVIEVDISKTQTEQAKLKHENKNNHIIKATTEFKVGDAHNLSIKSSSVDLHTCAMAWHWFDAGKFSEARRVLNQSESNYMLYTHCS